MATGPGVPAGRGLRKRIAVMIPTDRRISRGVVVENQRGMKRGAPRACSGQKRKKKFIRRSEPRAPTAMAYG